MDKHTAKCAALLPAQYRSEFSVLAQVMERASFLWKLLLGPLIWTLMNKHYVLGYHSDEEKLYLFRMKMGFFGLGEMQEVQTFALDELRDLQYRPGLLTATLIFQKPDGNKIKLFASMPSRKNVKTIYDAIRNTRTVLAS
jgi:hypothetical protein